MKPHNTDNSLHQETESFRHFFATFMICAASGLTSFFVEEVSIWVQWTYVAHVISSLLVTLFALHYLFIHIKRAMGHRRAGVFFSGILKTVVFFIVIFSGLHILIFGQTEQQRWVFTIHVYASFLVLLLFLLHLILHRFTLPKKRLANQAYSFLTINKSFFTLSITYLSLCISLIVAVSFIYESNNTRYSDEPIIKDYQYTYGEHPFRPSQTETYNGKFIDQRQIGNSHACESCHKEITEQWRSSMHRQAASDPTYVTNINLLEKNRGISATRYCEGCHAPVALLSGQLSAGGTHGGVSDTLAFAEGVGCMGCHGIENAVHLKGVASYLFKPATDYLFSNSTNSLAQMLNHFLIRINPSLHRKDMARSVLSTPELCATCHSQFMDKDMNNWGWVKMQDEYRAWLESPYSGQNQQKFSHTEKRRCQDCHMPLVAGKDPSANVNGQLFDHRTLGANTAIPKLNGDQLQYEKTKAFLQSGKLRVTIDPPNRSDAIRDAKFVEENLISDSEAPAFAYLGESINIKTIISNIGVGHNFPGGTIDINEAWMWFRVVDAQNKTVFESGQLLNDGSVDPQSIFFRSLPVDRQGKLVWKHDLFSMIGRSYKKIIPAGESDIIEYSFEIPSWVKNPLTITAVLRYRKFNLRYAKWALKEKYQELPIVDVAWDSIQLPLLVKPPIQ